MAAGADAVSNRLLHRLPDGERRLLEPYCEPMEFARGEVLCAVGRRIVRTIFPNDGIVSLRAFTEDGQSLEIAMLGREGVVGFPHSTGITLATTTAIVQGAGSATRIDPIALRRVLVDCPTLRNRIEHNARGLMVQVAATAACNQFHTIESRTARLMLTISERMARVDFALTQSSLAAMLGVRRPAINRAARVLSRGGLVHYSRGRVTVLDEPGLRAAACSCHGVIAGLRV